MWDTNDVISHPDIISFMDQCHLYDLLAPFNIPAEATTTDRGRRIDFIVGTALLVQSARRGGILSKEQSPSSDHRALYLDLDESTLFHDNSIDPTSPSVRLLRLNNPEQCHQYLDAFQLHLANHNVQRRLQSINEMIRSNFPLAKIIAAYESIDRDITAGMLYAERLTARAVYAFPWSPVLRTLGQELMFWRKRCSDFKLYRDSMASIADPSQIRCLDNAAIISLQDNRYDAQYAANNYKATRMLLDEYQSNAELHRRRHLEARARHAAATLQGSTEKAITNILKAEAARATFSKLRKHVKGLTHSSLQRVEIPHTDDRGNPTGDIESVTNPTQLFHAILTQNKLHFSQASNTPGATGNLSSILPPFARNLVTDAILAGTFDLSNIDPVPEVEAFLSTMKQPETLQGITPINVAITQEDFQHSFKVLPDKVASSPSGRHMTHYKVCAKSNAISAILASMITIPFQLGFSPKRWQKAIQVMLEKDTGRPLIHRLRVIQLLEADMNLAFRTIWGRRLISHALKHNTSSPWQFGNTPGASVHSALILKTLSYDFSRLTRTNIAVFNNDAKACYDRVIPSLGLMATERLGIPRLHHAACYLQYSTCNSMYAPPME